MAYRANDNGLTVRQDEFARLLAIGFTQVEAYRKCFPTAGKSAGAIEAAAHRVAAKPKVIVRIDAFLKEARPSDLHTQGQWMAALLADLDCARKAANWTAVAALTRLTGQAVGTLNEVLTVRAEQSMSDETLAKELGKKDPSLAGKLAVLLGGKRATHKKGDTILSDSAEKGVA